MSFDNASVETLYATRDRLLAGLDKVAERIAAGTFHVSVKEGQAPPSQAGQLTLSLLLQVEDALEAMVPGYQRVVPLDLVAKRGK
jgi:hypothetical protein